MPRQDKTGPLGQGPLTGRGLGPCGGGLAWRRGCGRRGLGPWGWPLKIDKKDEKQILEEEAGILEQELKGVKDRLTELKGK